MVTHSQWTYTKHYRIEDFLVNLNSYSIALRERKQKNHYILKEALKLRLERQKVFIDNRLELSTVLDSFVIALLNSQNKEVIKCVFRHNLKEYDQIAFLSPIIWLT